jgi:hypothetical protein
MNDTIGMSPEDVQTLIDIANDWAHEWVVIRADSPFSRDSRKRKRFYAYKEEPVFDDGWWRSDESDWPAILLTADNVDIDPQTFRIDNPAKC